MAVDVTHRTRFYQACSQCKKEFFDREEFENHPCFKNGSVFDANAKLGDTGIYGTGRNSVQKGKAAPQTKAEVLANSSENTGVADAADQTSVDLRLEAVKEITGMKQELVLAGVEAQTMTAEETRVAYAKLHADNAEKADAEKAAAAKKKKKA